MKYGFDNNRFFVEHDSCSRPVMSLREECEIRAQEIYKGTNKIILCVSSGLDSQIALHSFVRQNIPVRYIFFKQGNYNNSEYLNIKLLEKKFNIDIEIIDIDPECIKDEIFILAEKLNVHPNHALHYIFCRELPLDHDIIQVAHDPWIITRRDDGQHFVYHGYHDPEIARIRALEAIPNRTGKVSMFGESSEFFMSMITDPVFQNFFNSWKYFDNNGLHLNGKQIHDVYRYDYYIKPLMYSSHWGTDLLYFPKFKGFEHIDWINNFPNTAELESTYHCYIRYEDLINLYVTKDITTKRYYDYATLHSR